MSRLVLLALFVLSVASPGLAQTRPPDLSEMSLEDLMRIEITSVSRREQPASDAAAAIYVITHDAIRRSGMSTIPDLLRLAPGVNVAQGNFNKWAVSVRGFNGLYSNKLLVLVDGRSIYNRLFSGVFWEVGDLMLDDIDRIEVIRGPGAALWGANAMNGVINIVTKTAADTQGGLVRLDGGSSAQQGAVRYGGSLGSAHYRLHGQWTARDESSDTPGSDKSDGSDSVATGFRVDLGKSPGAFTLMGGIEAGRGRGLWPNPDPQAAAQEAFFSDPTETWGSYILGRWTKTRDSGASMQIQSFVDVAGRHEPVGEFRRHAFDVDTQYSMRLGARHQLIAGAGYRFTSERFDGNGEFLLIPPEDNASLVTGFVQDEIALLSNRLALILGSQVQYDSYSGMGVQPTARLMWRARPRQRVWAAASRALRTPSLIDRGLRDDLPPAPGPGGFPLFVTVLGNPAARTEQFIDAEVGYRLTIGSSASIDATGFAGRYDDLRTLEPNPPVVRFIPSPRVEVITTLGNELKATTRGFEIAAHWDPVPAWRLEASYSRFHLTPDLSPASGDPDGALEDGSAPRGQWQVRSGFSVGTRGTLDLAVFHVGPLELLQVDSYTRADVYAEWKFTSGLSLVAIGQNLLDKAHFEFLLTEPALLTTKVPRSASIRVRWTFQ
ncbi:MAG: TonB-dependent receptor [Vicinamibacterales bacterium]|jgi:iron complex outermembrane receptor protein